MSSEYDRGQSHARAPSDGFLASGFLATSKRMLKKSYLVPCHASGIAAMPVACPSCHASGIAIEAMLDMAYPVLATNQASRPAAKWLGTAKVAAERASSKKNTHLFTPLTATTLVRAAVSHGRHFGPKWRP